MRQVLLLSFFFPFLISCSKYQYISLAGENIQKDQEQQFIDEKDSVRIRYNFNGKNGPVNVTVYNKSTRPVQVDWKRSAVITGDSSVSLFEPQMKFSGEIERNRYSVNQNLSGSLLQAESIDFIPPFSSISRQTKFIQTKWLKLPEVIAETKKLKPYHQKIRISSFTQSNSPVVFRVYLTLVSEKADDLRIDNSFYVAEVIETKAAPINFVNSGDRFYIKEKTGFGNISTAVFGLGLTVLLIAAL